MSPHSEEQAVSAATAAQHPPGTYHSRQPRRGFLVRAWRALWGERIKRAHVSDHGVFMRSLGRAWAIPMTLVFSSGALITLGQKQIAVLVGQYQHHQPLDYVTLALLAITFVIVGGMDLTLLNSAVELRDARLRGVDPRIDPYTRGARLRVWLVSLVESATFMAVAYQLDQPPSLDRDPGACLVAWGFIAARALAAPVCAMYLATLGKRALVRREMYGNLLLTIGGTIQQIIENLQLAADERLIEPLWRMQVLVDRASRARSDEEMDRFDDELLSALSTLRTLRERLAVSGHGPAAASADSQAHALPLSNEQPSATQPAEQRYSSGAVSADQRLPMEPLEALEALEALAAPDDDEPMPTGRYNYKRLDDRLAATR
jgi:hypothetical protein